MCTLESGNQSDVLKSSYSRLNFEVIFSMLLDYLQSLGSDSLVLRCTSANTIRFVPKLMIHDNAMAKNQVTDTIVYCAFFVRFLKPT